MTPGEFERRLVHPENGPMALEAMLALYAWHVPPRVAHVTKLVSERLVTVVRRTNPRGIPVRRP